MILSRTASSAAMATAAPAVSGARCRATALPATRVRIQRGILAAAARGLQVDVCIVGGGIVGTAAACALAKSPFLANKTIALIEAGDLMRTPALESGTFANRASSITPGSARFLQGLGVWDAIEPKQAYTRMVVWDSESDGRVDFDAYSHGAGAAAMPEGHGPAIAWMVQNHLIQHQLAECVARTPSIVLFNESKVHSIVRSESSGLPVVSLDRGEPIECQLLVGADGLHSKVREYAGIESIGWDYDQHGIVATLAVEDDGTGNDTAWQRFLPTGPIALLPLAPGYSSLVWSTKPAIAAKLTKAAPEVFVELVNAAFHNPVADIDFLGSQVQADGSIADGVDIAGEASWGRERARGQDSGERMPPRVVGVQPKSRAPFPLRLRNSTSYVYERTALIGDAAHTTHPLAGQGLNLGLADARALAASVSDAAQAGGDVGGADALGAYAAARFASGAAMLAAADGTSRVFGGLVPSQLRGIGMRLVNGSARAKALLAAVASA